MEQLRVDQLPADQIRLTEAETEAVVALHARLQSERESQPTLKDLIEVLRIPEAEARALLAQVRHKEPVTQPQVVVVERQHRHLKLRLGIAGVMLVLGWMLMVYSMNRPSPVPGPPILIESTVPTPAPPPAGTPVEDATATAVAPAAAGN